jgi:hypothetical protein
MPAPQEIDPVVDFRNSPLRSTKWLYWPGCAAVIVWILGMLAA